ncbi:MAG: murein L,D-transpeptidase catalytic domain family protein [Thermoanaerobaculia bacterium]
MSSPAVAVKRILAISAVVMLGLSADAANAAPPPPESFVQELVSKAPGLRPEVLRLAMAASRSAAERGLVKRDGLLTVIDYSIASTEPRLFVFDLDSKTLLFRELVAHGKNSGGKFTTRFSNEEGSLATSLGLFVTSSTYNGSNGYSLRLDGLDRGFNDNAMERAIVMHGANYVNETTARSLGRLGRSWGCPAVRQEISRKMIDTLRGGSPIFAYYPDTRWLASSEFLPRGGAAGTAVAAR